MKDGLNTCIEIESDRISRRVTIPRQVNFKLTPEVIDQLQHIKTKKHSLKLNSKQIVNLRYYTLLNAYLLNKTDDGSDQQSELIFSSYLPISYHFSTTVIRSTINSSGQISQEIQQDLWQNPDLLFKTIEIHYWLVEEIFRQLPLSRQDYSSLLILVCWLPIAILFTVLFWFCLPLSFVYKAIVIFIGITLLKIALNYLIRKKLRSWILKQLSNGIFSQQYQRRKIGFSLLNFVFKPHQDPEPII